MTLDRDEVRRRTTRVLAEMGMLFDADDRLADLSRSELAMIEAARILADGYDVAFVDEVSQDLNPREVEELGFILDRLTSAGRSVVYITHRLEEALRLCDRVAVMTEGVISDLRGAKRLTVEDIGQSMFGEVPHVPARRVLVRDDVALALRDVDCGGREPVRLELRRGESMGLLGPRGAGMERLIGALNGERPQPDAAVIVDGAVHRIEGPADAVRLRIGHLVVSDDDPGAEHALAQGLLMEGLSQDASYDEEMRAVQEMLAALRLAEQATIAVSGQPRMSGGQAQWQRLRDIMADNAQVLILEEPARALDLRARAELGELLSRATADGRSLIVVSSDVRDLRAFTDRLLVFEDGGIQAVWPTEDATDADIEAVFRSWSPPARKAESA